MREDRFDWRVRLASGEREDQVRRWRERRPGLTAVREKTSSIGECRERISSSTTTMMTRVMTVKTTTKATDDSGKNRGEDLAKNREYPDEK
ncbi:hypothetical protein Ddye_005107 [Dipteronia dyeriana]|uniref:Uncharacterized protein n=1 Tax=Dipteronia dyeriana TaxID=168575 RepID=A0AAD9XFN7_9ROSI|nr:hypothetical protein Ddye_005107 [Dipteronia dyeriana]